MSASTIALLLGGAFIYWLCVSNKGQAMLFWVVEIVRSFEYGVSNLYRWMKQKSGDPQVNVVLRGIFWLLSSVAWGVWLAVCVGLALLVLYAKLHRGLAPH